MRTWNTIRKEAMTRINSSLSDCLSSSRCDIEHCTQFGEITEIVLLVATCLVRRKSQQQARTRVKYHGGADSLHVDTEYLRDRHSSKIYNAKVERKGLALGRQSTVNNREQGMSV